MPLPSLPQKICLIGGSGFIGTRLVQDLKKAGHTVTIADLRPPCTEPDAFFIADVRDKASLRECMKNCTIIINLAAEHRDNVRPLQLYYDVNVTGAENVCHIAEELGINTIVFTSSVAVYGAQEMADEECPHIPLSPYGITKSKAEQAYSDWQKKSPEQRTLILIRPTVVFGQGNRGNVHNLISHVLSTPFIMIGDGKNRKAIAYVGNVSAFIVHCLALKSGLHIYNYTDEPAPCMNELISFIRKVGGKPQKPRLRLPKLTALLLTGLLDGLSYVTGKKFPISRIRVEKFCATTVFSTNTLTKSGFVAPFELYEALDETIRAEFPREV